VKKEFFVNKIHYKNNSSKTDDYNRNIITIYKAENENRETASDSKYENENEYRETASDSKYENENEYRETTSDSKYENENEYRETASDSKYENENNNIALLCEYDGTAFQGWQSQRNNKTVQEAIQKAIFDITNEYVILYGCSRTDAGVHAKGHMSNFFSKTKISTDKLPLAINSYLPPEVSIKKAALVADNFNSRFDTTAKRYVYSIYNNATRPALDRLRAYHVPRKLDLEKIKAAAVHFIGEHDFAGFMASNSSAKTTVRTLYSVDIVENGNIIEMVFTGNGFLYNMVRILAGTLCYVGLGKIKPDDIPSIIESKDRRLSGKTLPAHGLCLDKVFYKEEIFE
jgi:tRNA pseudouridine38-40 synthase